MTDKITRCPWTGDDPEYIDYHDREWGVPNADDQALFEKLVLEGFQAGLSWITILRKRENFREAFDDFDIEKIASYTDKKLQSLMTNAGIIRNRAKIEATRTNAQAFLRLSKRTKLSHFLWDFLDGRPINNNFQTMSEVPAKTPLSTKISNSLKSEGFKFVGPTTVYAFMQSTGFVNDHLKGCKRHKECAKIADQFSLRQP